MANLTFLNDDVPGQQAEVSYELHVTIRHKTRILAQFASSYVIVLRNPNNITRLLPPPHTTYTAISNSIPIPSTTHHIPQISQI